MTHTLTPFSQLEYLHAQTCESTQHECDHIFWDYLPLTVLGLYMEQVGFMSIPSVLHAMQAQLQQLILAS